MLFIIHFTLSLSIAFVYLILSILIGVCIDLDFNVLHFCSHTQFPLGPIVSSDSD